ncbi:MAG: hypothetical protein OEV01_03120 [Nitrospira sp.]|nr:hypothetical protein [Nitrospira sp.]MDH4304672.1 hypothetical protein [Nitrospira sp.]MDH5193588.1 hypothetical protein [Nitrospira sp.]
MKTGALTERVIGKVSDFGPLFDYTVKLVLLASFLELVLYRLLSRLGMHLSKMAATHPWITPTFTTLTEVGAWLLNIVAVLLFLGLTLTMMNRWGGTDSSRLVKSGMIGTALLLVLTVGFLVVQPGMLGAIVYNGLTLVVLTLFVSDYVMTHRETTQRALAITYYLGVSGWLYYQIVSTSYSLMGTIAQPPLAYESHRMGEALMVLASFCAFLAYGKSKSLSLRTKNRQQRNRAIWFWTVTGVTFSALIVVDYLLDRITPGFASAFRQASQGIGWIFQFGMGYTFYLPFAVYVGGLLCWSYTVVKLLTMGRLAGYGIGLMFIAGYALMFSNLTLMVVLGVMLLACDRVKVATAEALSTSAGPMVPASDGLMTGRA